MSCVIHCGSSGNERVCCEKPFHKRGWDVERDARVLGKKGGRKWPSLVCQMSTDRDGAGSAHGQTLWMNSPAFRAAHCSFFSLCVCRFPRFLPLLAGEVVPFIPKWPARCSPRWQRPGTLPWARETFVDNSRRGADRGLSGT